MRFDPIHRFERVDSTNEEAFRALAAGSAGPGHAFVAREQSAGRGRHGRPWWSAPGEGLYLSAIWSPTKPLSAPLLTITAGLATLRALQALGAPGLDLKWPNDVMHARGKLAGILVESRDAQAASPHFIVGVGVNRAQASFPPELRQQQPVTSLAQVGLEVGEIELETALLESLGRECARAEWDPAGVCADYVQASPWTRESLALEGPDGQESGRFLALDAARGLSWQPEQGPARWVRLEFIRSLRPIGQDS